MMEIKDELLLKDFISYRKGKPPKENGNLVLIPLLTPDYLRHASTPQMVPASDSLVMIDKGEIVLLWDGSNAGEFFISKKGALASTMVVFNYDTKKIDTQYLYYALKNKEHALKFQTNGSGIPHVDKEILLGYSIKNYNRPEQTKIAQILSTIDEAIEQTEALIQKYQNIKTGLMQDLLTKGIDKQGQIRSEETHEFWDSPIGRIPVEWKVKNIGSVCEAIDPQPSHRTPKAVLNGVPYIGISDFIEDTIDLSSCRKVSFTVLEEHQQRYQLRQGDIIFGKIGTIGEPKLLPMGIDYTLSANVILLQPSTTPSFIFHTLTSISIEIQVKNEIQSTTQPAFGMEKIRALKIPFPKKEERIKIAKTIDSVNQSIVKLESKLKKIKPVKTGLMQDLLTGKKRVTHLL